jgi:Fe-S-cluster-containing hydrogenase component 2
MDAIRMEDGTAVVSRDNCIGCGLCVSTCPEDAVKLEAKSDEERQVPPPSFSEALKAIAMQRMKR